MPTIAAGRGAPSSSISSRRNSAVGALPMATTAPPSRSAQRSSAAAERVVPRRVGEVGDARVVEGADHLVAGGKARAGDAVGDHLGVAEDRRAGGERGTRRGDEAGAEDDVRRELDHARGVDHADRDLGLVRA